MFGIDLNNLNVEEKKYAKPKPVDKRLEPEPARLAAQLYQDDESSKFLEDVNSFFKEIFFWANLGLDDKVYNRMSPWRKNYVS